MWKAAEFIMFRLMNVQKLNGESTPNTIYFWIRYVIMRNSNRPFIPANDYEMKFTIEL